MNELELRFHKAMIQIYEHAKSDCKYNATRFIGMVADKGGLSTARYLLSTDKPSDGFTALWECQRLDLTVEALVLNPDFTNLFTEEEQNIAKHRLGQYGYKFQ